ncbi:MAG TPA: DedA family protein [Rubrobacteraceae bacterium]|nr:DedA family protein [Rubrobacteraceae bacterium]
MLENLGQWIQSVMGSLGYLGLALLLVLENLFPPIPSEVVLPLAGFFVGRGVFSFWGALLAATVGATSGALVLYGLGRSGGRALVLRYGKWLHVTAEDLNRAEGWFRRYGDWVVLGARLVPFARSVVSVPAGTSRMPLLRFTILTTIGSAVWNTVLIVAGYALGASWERVSGWVGAYSDVILVAVIAAAILYPPIRYLRRRMREG